MTSVENTKVYEERLGFRFERTLSKSNTAKEIPETKLFMEAVHNICQKYYVWTLKPCQDLDAFKEDVSRAFKECGPRVWPDVGVSRSAWLLDAGKMPCVSNYPLDLYYSNPEHNRRLFDTFREYCLKKCRTYRGYLNRHGPCFAEAAGSARNDVLSSRASSIPSTVASSNHFENHETIVVAPEAVMTCHVQNHQPSPRLDPYNHLPTSSPSQTTVNSTHADRDGAHKGTTEPGAGTPSTHLNNIDEQRCSETENENGEPSRKRIRNDVTVSPSSESQRKLLVKLKLTTKKVTNRDSLPVSRLVHQTPRSSFARASAPVLRLRAQEGLAAIDSEAPHMQNIRQRSANASTSVSNVQDEGRNIDKAPAIRHGHTSLEAEQEDSAVPEPHTIVISDDEDSSSGQQIKQEGRAEDYGAGVSTSRPRAVYSQESTKNRARPGIGNDTSSADIMSRVRVFVSFVDGGSNFVSFKGCDGLRSWYAKLNEQRPPSVEPRTIVNVLVKLRKSEDDDDEFENLVMPMVGGEETFEYLQGELQTLLATGKNGKRITLDVSILDRLAPLPRNA